MAHFLSLRCSLALLSSQAPALPLAGQRGQVSEHVSPAVIRYRPAGALGSAIGGPADPVLSLRLLTQPRRDPVPSTLMT